jgi:3-oxoacyl-[acyl-carrier protein] reductase
VTTSGQSLQDRIAVVTGAGSGIGLATARRLSGLGATVVLCDIDKPAAEDACQALATAGATVAAAEVDVRSAAATDRLAGFLRERYGRLDILVNNAGLVRDAALHKMTDEQWDIVNDVIARGAFNCLRSCAGLLRAVPDDGRHRKVVNIASVSGIYGRELSANYCAAKAALIGLTKATAREWAGRKINVNAVAPGYIGGTGLTTPSADGTTSMREDFAERVVAEIPIGRGGCPDDVAALVAFLASTDADYITGQVIELHGGLEILRV